MSTHEKNGMSNGKKVFLDTTGACFLCLNEPSTDTVLASSSATTGGGRISLRDICRFLEINELEGFPSNDGDSCRREQFGFVVDLCGTCLAHVNQMVELIHEMEGIQKRMTCQLQQFHGILEGSMEGDRSSLQKEKILKKNPITASIVECLRKEANRKCREKLGDLGRQTVTLQGVQLNEASTSSMPLQKVPKAITVNPQNSSANGLTIRKPLKHGDKLCRTNLSHKHAKSSSKATIMEIFGRNYKTSGGGDGEPSKLECLHCDFAFAGKPGRMRSHLLIEHPETLFPSAKTPQLSQEDFMKCVKALMKRQSDEGRAEAKIRKISSKNGSKSPLYCVLCQLPYVNGYDYRYHLIVEHYDTLKRKCALMQEDYSKGNAPINRSDQRGKRRKIESDDGSVVGGVELMEEDLEGGGKVSEEDEASGTDANIVTNGDYVKEEVGEESSDVDFIEIAGSRAEDDSDLFECNVFAVKSEK